MLQRLRAIAILSFLCAACQSTTRIPSDATSLLPPSSLDGWVGGSTFDPGNLADSGEEKRNAKLAEWTTAAKKHWRVEGGELVSDGQGPHLVTAKDYGDFELWLDWKLLPNGDSGIYLRGYPQVQLWDPANEREWGNGSDKGSGALWNNQTHERFPLALADVPAGEWNEMYVKLKGDVVTVELNGQLVVDEVVLENYFHRDQAIRARGPIHLQTHGSETRFRNLYLREL
jgi:hypothetical protein